MLKSILIHTLLFLKKFDIFSSITILRGELSIKVESPDGTVKRHVFNTAQTDLLNKYAALIGATGNTNWIGANGFLPGVGNDGIVIHDAGNITTLGMTTTKYAGGDGSAEDVTFRGVVTIGPSFTSINIIAIGAAWQSSTTFTAKYGQTTASITVAQSDVVTVDYTLGFS